MEHIKEGTEGIKEDMKDVKRDVKEGTESIKDTVKEVKRVIEESMKESTKKIERCIQTKECCTKKSVESIERGSLSNPGVPAIGELYLVGFRFALSILMSLALFFNCFSAQLSDAISQCLLQNLLLFF